MLFRSNLVVETDLTENHEFFLTEKTIKLLLVGQPFVIVSTPNFLNHLHQLGFKTYNLLWNEDYDQEPNFELRVQKIIQLCNYLSKFDWQAHRPELEQIQKHNRFIFNCLTHVVNCEFNRLENIIQGI